MPKIKPSSSNAPKRRVRPALTPEARENQLISMAVDLAEQQLIDGTASSQVITHYLKLGSMKNKYEMEKLKAENDLLRAKAKSIEDQADIKQIYTDAINAMKRYSGHGDESDEY